ncbi:MAG: hemolysin family protein [Actinomycetota bacterium]|jgi:CBS domain containing-hemolysin-like protein
MSDLFVPLSIVVLVVIAAFAALAETAIVRIGRLRPHHLAKEKKAGAEVLVKVVEDPAPFLNALLLVILLAELLAAALATGLALRWLDTGGEIIAALVTTILLFAFAQVVPRTYAVQRTDRAALLVARPVYVLGQALRPLGKLLILTANLALLILPGRGMPKGPFVTDEEIRHMSDGEEEEEEIEEEERELIHSIFEFGDTVVREVMVPRPDMVTLKVKASRDEALERIVEAGYSRIPLYDGDTDNIVGVLYAKDLLKKMHESEAPAKLVSIARAPTFVPETKKVAELLREMQEQRVHMAIVVDEYGGTAGLVTIEDLLEEIVGEIVDEYDVEEPLVEPIDDDSIRVDAKMPIDEVNDLLSVELPHEEWDTVGGLVFGLTGRVPVAGESVRYDSVEFVTERVAGRRVQKVVIRKLPPEPEPEQA